MKDIQSIIADHPLFQSMEPAQLKILADCGREVTFNPGHVLIQQGEPADQFFLILSGQVALDAIETGAPEITLEILADGDVLGWSWLFQPFRSHFRAKALEKTTVVAFNGAHLLIACEKEHQFGYELMKRIAQVVIQRLQTARKAYATTTLQQQRDRSATPA